MDKFKKQKKQINTVTNNFNQLASSHEVMGEDIKEISEMIKTHNTVLGKHALILESYNEKFDGDEFESRKNREDIENLKKKISNMKRTASAFNSNYDSLFLKGENMMNGFKSE